MEQEKRQILFALLRCAICGAELTSEEKNSYSLEQLSEVLEIAKMHDIAHLVIFVLKQSDMLIAEYGFLGQELLGAVFRYERLEYERKCVCEALEEAEIPFMPLKGAVIRRYYPEPWMRTSCDIDVLVHEEDLGKAVACLEEKLGYSKGAQGRHDIPLRSASGVNLELHYDLVESDVANDAAKVLEQVWDVAMPKEDKVYWQEMPDELFYFYHIAHMAKHIQQGGCGVRPCIDLWLLDKQTENTQRREALLKEGNLSRFVAVARRLSKVWMEDAPHDEITEKLENYILQGGVFGALSNKIAIAQQKRGGKLGYVLSKVFVPYDVIKYHYPILQKRPWLTPFMQVRRWCKLIFCGHARRTMQELSYNQNLPKSQAEEVRLFLEDVGL